MPLLSVIIPTHNRADILEQTLQHLEAQTIAEEIEVIVINDVQDDKDFQRVAKSAWQIPIYFETIEPCHQGAARNKGVQKAQSSTVLFLGDDMFPEPECCKKHLDAHVDGRATLGFSTWDTSVGVTPVMRWLEESGWQFGYPFIEKYAHKEIPPHMQPQFTYTGNLSIATELARVHPFREDVSLYGWEDTEWGMRLQKNGVRLYYEPDAATWHHHHMTLQDSLKRMHTLGTSAVHMQQIEPTFDRVPKSWKLLVYKLSALLPTMAGKHRKAFLEGIRDT